MKENFYKGKPLIARSRYYNKRIVFLSVYLFFCISLIMPSPGKPWYAGIAGILVITVFFWALGSAQDWKRILQSYEDYKKQWEEDNK